MKLRQNQFDPRENTVPSRRHVARFSTNGGQAQCDGLTSVLHDDASGTFKRNQNEATVNEEGKAERSPKLTQARELNDKTTTLGFRSGVIEVNFEPLLDVTEAAKLLRIHPKTLRHRSGSAWHKEN